MKWKEFKSYSLSEPKGNKGCLILKVNHNHRVDKDIHADMLLLLDVEQIVDTLINEEVIDNKPEEVDVYYHHDKRAMHPLRYNKQGYVIPEKQANSLKTMGMCYELESVSISHPSVELKLRGKNVVLDDSENESKIDEINRCLRNNELPCIDSEATTKFDRIISTSSSTLFDKSKNQDEQHGGENLAEVNSDTDKHHIEEERQCRL